MPHVVLENIISAKEAFDSIVLFTTKIDRGVLKVTDRYLNAGQNTALVESLAIENGKNQSFFCPVVAEKDESDGWIAASHRPQKTPGVKTIMAILARQIKDSNPNVHYGKNNLQDFLME